MIGRGGQRGRGRGNREWNTKPPVTQNGPLMTDHLRSIEIELEILNRRRQMIQQEHELLDREREFNLKRQYEYEQPMTSNNQPYYYHQQGNKRQAIENTLKRFNPPPRVEPWENNTQSKPSFVSRPPHLLSLAPIRSPIRPSRPVVSASKEFRLSKPPAPVRKDFNPTKVTKQRSHTSYLKKTPMSANQPNSSYVPTKFNEAKTASPVKEDALLILHHDVQPSLQLTGRLELALGSILKDIKKLDPINFTHLSTHAVQCKVIKQIIRERIRSVMMGKNVGHMQDIVAQYREKYPVETDAEVLKLGQDFQAYNIHNLGIMPTIDSDYIKEFFKVNLKDVLHKKVEKLLNDIDISADSENSENVIKMMDDVIELKDSEISDYSTQVAESQYNDFSKDEETEEVKIGQAIKKAKIYLNLMEKLMHEKFPSVVLKHKNKFVSMIQADKEYKIAKADILEKTIKETVKLIAMKIDNSNKEEDANVLDSFTKKKTSIAKTTETSKEIEPITIQEATSPKINSKPDLSTVKPLVQTLKQDFSPLVKTPTSKILDHPYYVKVIGRPELPGRAAVYLYLEQFKPASIKKHKTIGNLLVIGFNEKEGYDKILEASDKTIGGNTITVKASEKVSQVPRKQTLLEGGIENALEDESPKKNSNAVKEVPQKSENENSDKDSVDVKENNSETPNITITSNDILNIGQDLEDQITNLLTVINNGDNNENADTSKSSRDNEDIVGTSKNSGDSDNNADTSNSKEEMTEDASEINIEINKSTSCDETNKDNKVKTMESNSEANENLNSNNTNDNQENETEKLTLETDTGKENNDKSEETKTENKFGVKDSKSYLKNSGRATPTRSSSRLASTPCTIKTRRASRLAQDNEQKQTPK